MTKAGNSQIMRTITLLITIFSLNLPAYAQYSGGTGEPNDPYQIATAEDLMLLGDSPEDYDKHFILIADIDLDPNLPGGKVFGRAVIAADTNDIEDGFGGTSFTGVFDGNGHTISRLTIRGDGYLGLFGQLGYCDSGPYGHIKNLGLVDVSITASDSYVGGLVAVNAESTVTECYSTGTICGRSFVGGLVGEGEVCEVTRCYSRACVRGSGQDVGGLVGMIADWSSVTQCYSTGAVSGNERVGGLVGSSDSYSVLANGQALTQCYSTGAVNGNRYVGGLVGINCRWGRVTQCYSTGAVSGADCVGGLVGFNESEVTACFWDTQTSGQASSAGGTGKTSAEMQTAKTFLDAGWDFVGETANGAKDIWKIAEGLGYPRLSWEKYSGGTGEPNDPYQIATAADLIALGETLADYDKHFILTADIDLDPNLPGGRVFDRAVIAPVTYDDSGYGGYVFGGTFNGDGHTISHLTITGKGSLGLFGWLSGKVRNLGVVDANITASGGSVGALAGSAGTVTSCYSTGAVKGTNGVGGLVGGAGTLIQCYSSCAVTGSDMVGGLVGLNYYYGSVTQCYSTGTVDGGVSVGGLVGLNGSSLLSGLPHGTVTRCYSTGTVSGKDSVGGLVGRNDGVATNCYSSSTVSGDSFVGGLVGDNGGKTHGHQEPSAGTVTNCYSTGTVSGDSSVGGLVGYNGGAPGGDYISPAPGGTVTDCYSSGLVNGTDRVGGLVGSNTDDSGNEGFVTQSFWDIQASGQATSDAGTGKTTAQMQTASTFLDAGWDLVGETANGTHELWQILEGGGYPVLTTFSGYTPPKLQGMGTVDDPYLISDAMELGAMVHYSPRAHYRLAASIDLSGIRWGTSVIPQFAGTFDGNGQTISHLTINGQGYLGLFDRLEGGAQLTDLGVTDVNITGSGDYVGGLVGTNWSAVTQCYSTGAVSGTYDVGGLVGRNCGSVTQCYSTGTVIGNNCVGGLVGKNAREVTNCYSTTAVSGISAVGGLAGLNNGRVTQCYSAGSVTGLGDRVGGLVGCNGYEGVVYRCHSSSAVSGTYDVGGLVGGNDDGTIMMSYSTGSVDGNDYVGGLVGYNSADFGTVTACFWDIQTSGQTTGNGGMAKATTEMHTAKTFLDAGWDFVGETANGTDDIWWILEGQDYPRLWWEAHD